MTRYNQLGEWKPFTEGADEAFAASAAEQLAAGDLAVREALFYVFYTGHQVLEFAVATTVSLPVEQIDLVDGRMHLWRCPIVEPIQNEIVYDCWWDLADTSPDSVREAHRIVSQVLNRLAFSFGATIHWRPKYTLFATIGGYRTPALEDLPTLHRHLALRGVLEEDAVLDAALDWYNRAHLSRNPFAAFLSYYIPIETVALSIGAASTDFGISAPTITRAERREARLTCVHQLHESIYASDPLRFVEQAYFHCLQSLREQVRTALDAVFGAGSREGQAVVDGIGGAPSLMNLRSRVAHGQYSLAAPEHVSEVRSRTPEMAAISRAFLTRLILQVASTDTLSPSPATLRAGVSFSDPRDLHMVSAPVIAGGDWRIRPAWCHE